jgi:hypothetical protein
VARLLPWGGATAAARYDALAAKHAALTAKDDALAARVAALEQRPAPPTVDIDAINSAQAAVARRVAALETTVDGLRRTQEEASTTKTALGQLTQRLDKIEAQTTAQAAAEAADLQKIGQELAQRGAAANDLAGRLGALEHQVTIEGNADRTGPALMLALLQMREAVDEARPFPSEYAVFQQLAARQPDLVAAAAPLANAAGSGVASRAALRERLTEVAGQAATAAAPSAKPEWWQQALDRLRRLVTIRHIDDGAKTGPEAAVAAGQSALAQGDLRGAIAEVEKLTGADAEVAQPWLRLARRRLAAETALTHLQELLTARLGAAPSASPASPASPGAAPPPAVPRTPS